MTPMLLPVATGLLAALFLFWALAAYTLRDFSRSRLDEICRRWGRPQRFGEILKEYERALVAVETWMALTAVALIGVLLVGYNGWRPLPAAFWDWVTYIVQALAALVTLVFFSVVLPWSIARAAGEPFLAATWPLLRLAETLTAPVLSVAQKFDTLVHRLAGVPEPANTIDQLTEEIRSVVDEGQREGLLHSDARTMIHRVMELSDEDVAAVMTPRTEMHTIHVDATREQARLLLLEFGHSRVPVVGDTIDDIVGILYAKDLLHQPEEIDEQAFSLRNVVRDPIYVPETTHVDKLLQRMKKERVHIAIVIDEYSGVAGLVTLEDVLEEIVGEITDEYDTEEEEGIRAVSPDVIDVTGWVHIDDLNERFEFDLPEDGDFETIGGFVFNQLGRVPKNRDTFTWRQLRVTVLEADERRIHHLRIERDRTLAATAADET